MMFVHNKLTDDEILSGSILSSLQKQVLQNRMCELANQVVTAATSRVDAEYFDKVNFCKGQLAEIKSMLETSEALEQQLNRN